MNFTTKLRKCHLFGVLNNILDPKGKKLSRIPRKFFFFQFFGQIDIQWQKLILISSQYSKFCKKNCKLQRHSRNPNNSWMIPGMIEFCIENQVLWQKVSVKNTLFIEIEIFILSKLPSFVKLFIFYVNPRSEKDNVNK